MPASRFPLPGPWVPGTCSDTSSRHTLAQNTVVTAMFKDRTFCLTAVALGDPAPTHFSTFYHFHFLLPRSSQTTKGQPLAFSAISPVAAVSSTVTWLAQVKGHGHLNLS